MRLQPILATALLLFAIQVFAIKPIKSYRAIPSDMGIPFSKDVVPVKNATIVTWFMRHNDPKAKTIIICNSDYGNMSYSLPVAGDLYKAGYDIILFDYRGFGESSSFAIDTNRLFYMEYCDDFAGVYSYYQKKYNVRPAVYAMSMGTIIATITNAEQSRAIQAPLFIYDSFIESLDYTVAYLKDLKKRPFSSPITGQIYARYVEKLKQKKVLFFRGTIDLIAHQQNDQMPVNKNWKVVEFNGGHMQAPYVVKEKMLAEMGAAL